jgi:hypothetical protein
VVLIFSEPSLAAEKGKIRFVCIAYGSGITKHLVFTISVLVPD